MTVQKIELEELVADSVVSDKPLLSENFSIIKNVKVRLQVVLGEAEVTIDEFFRLKNGSNLMLDRDLCSPVDVLLEGRVVARGTLVAVDDNFGVQITEIGD